MSRQEQNERFLQTSFLYGGNAAYIEDLYAQFQNDPASLDQAWQDFFIQFQNGPDKDAASDVTKSAQGPSWQRGDWPQAANGELVNAFDGDWPEISNGIDAAAIAEKIATKPAPAPNGAAAPATAPMPVGGVTLEEMHRATQDSIRAIMMIRAYRMRGHLHADLDPLKIEPPKEAPELDPVNYGFQPEDNDRKIFIDNYLGLEYATVPEMLEILKRTYCSTLGVEFMHISDPVAKAWVQERIEGPDKKIAFTDEGKKAILRKLVEADGFEQFLDIKYTGTKRFGLDGGESLVPALEQIIKRGGALGVKDIVLGMAHRGRLNVLSQVMNKPMRAIFHEFFGGSYKPEDVEGSGDVKYHLGASADREFDGNKVHLSLTANPSHLEIVNPVVLGKCRAKQDQLSAVDGIFVEPANVNREEVMPLLLHGDAAFAGQGVVPECLGLSGLRGHRTGGSVHVIINNQIGFTTYPRFSRSSPYPSDVAKMIEAPVFHANGDDPEAVVYAAKIATEFRQKFKVPVVLDIICYRRHGHNEGLEPAFTQPLMYKKIRAHDTTLVIYAKRLIAEGVLSQADVDTMKAEWRAHLDAELDAGKSFTPDKADWLDGKWSNLKTADADGPRRGQTGFDIDGLKKIGHDLAVVPKKFHAHRTIQRFAKNREKMIDSGEGIDWATAEALAFGTLTAEGHPVRLAGQDCETGTFSQRHSVLYDQEDETRYVPLDNLSASKARYEVVNSMLSEEAVLGFEYGYSLAEPNALTIWEAQFGDFANGAQVIFDQFIASGERKWLRMSGLVVMLPHGYEGQGPEHSSARIERFLQGCAEDNMQIANCTSPSNLFHILRRQLKRDFRKPLILFTPKSLLRHKKCVSRLDEFGPDSTFHRILWDDAQLGDGKSDTKLVGDDKIRRVILCTGKVYFDLLEERDSRGIEDVYLMRLEQLYPFPAKAMFEELGRFINAEIIWCQEEPKNMGCWSFIQPYVEWVMEQLGRPNDRPRYIGRAASASTATGLMSAHKAQLAAFLNEAMAE